MSGYMGPMKTKTELFLKLLKRVQRPKYILHILENREGLKAAFYYYKGESFDEGDCVKLKATIAGHRISSEDGCRLTYLDEVTILENKGSVEKPKKPESGVGSIPVQKKHLTNDVNLLYY